MSRLRVGTPATPDDARPFLGEWTSVLDGPSAPITVAIVVRIADGQIVGTVSSDMFAEVKVDEITNTQKGIALRFHCEVWGYSGAMVLSLVRDRDRLQVEFSILNGQFISNGVARRKPSSLLVPVCYCTGETRGGSVAIATTGDVTMRFPLAAGVGNGRGFRDRESSELQTCRTGGHRRCRNRGGTIACAVRSSRA